jgi:hypothetical protein
MSDVLRRAPDVKSIVSNDSLPKWRRTTQALQVFAGLDLTGLPDDLGKTLESNFVAVNRILATYQIKKSEDYEQLMDTDLQQILDILVTLVSRIAEAY